MISRRILTHVIIRYQYQDIKKWNRRGSWYVNRKNDTFEVSLSCFGFWTKKSISYLIEWTITRRYPMETDSRDDHLFQIMMSLILIFGVKSISIRTCTLYVLIFTLISALISDEALDEDLQFFRDIVPTKSSIFVFMCVRVDMRLLKFHQIKHEDPHLIDVCRKYMELTQVHLFLQCHQK